jgi:hypothetical protein
MVLNEKSGIMVIKMALSNWAICGINEKGEPNGGKMISPEGLETEIYKSWLNIKHKSLYKRYKPFGNYYTDDTIMHVHSTNLTLLDMDIVVRKSPGKQGVFVYCEIGEFSEKEKKMKYKCMFGIGIYGYSGSNWIGITRKIAHKYCEWVKNCEYIHFKDIKEEDLYNSQYNQGDAFFIGEEAAIKRAKSGTVKKDRSLLSGMIKRMR